MVITLLLLGLVAGPCGASGQGRQFPGHGRKAAALRGKIVSPLRSIKVSADPGVTMAQVEPPVVTLSGVLDYSRE